MKREFIPCRSYWLKPSQEYFELAGFRFSAAERSTEKECHNYGSTCPALERLYLPEGWRLDYEETKNESPSEGGFQNTQVLRRITVRDEKGRARVWGYVEYCGGTTYCHGSPKHFRGQPFSSGYVELLPRFKVVEQCIAMPSKGIFRRRRSVPAFSVSVMDTDDNIVFHAGDYPNQSGYHRPKKGARVQQDAVTKRLRNFVDVHCSDIKNPLLYWD